MPTPPQKTGHRELMTAERRGDTQRLLEALRDPEKRWWAARSVGNLGLREAVPHLMRLLDASDPDIRCVAIQSLAKLRAEEAADRLMAIAVEDEMDWVRSWAIDAVANLGAAGQLGERDIVPLLSDYLHDPSWKVRASAAHGLGVLGDPRALDPLLQARRRERGIKNRYLTRRAYKTAIRAVRQREPLSAPPVSTERGGPTAGSTLHADDQRTSRKWP